MACTEGSRQLILCLVRRMQTIAIGNVAFDLADFLDTRDEEDGTLVAYPPFTDFANLRFTVSTIRRDGVPSPGAGERFIRSTAAKEQRELQESSGTVWFSYSDTASEGSTGSTMTYWEVGFGPHMVTISCFVDSADGDPALKQRVFDSVIPTIQSLRYADANA